MDTMKLMNKNYQYNEPFKPDNNIIITSDKRGVVMDLSWDQFICLCIDPD